MEQINFYKKAEQYVSRLFNEQENIKLHYHNLDHTKYVVEKASEIAGHYQLGEREMLVIYLAAWFHDTGYLAGITNGHEEKGVEILRNFLKKYEMEISLEEEIASCIMATKEPRNPQNICEEIICDADTYNLGTKEFSLSNQLVYKEIQLLNGVISKDDFDASTLKMMQAHTFYTSYCKDVLTKRKKKNMRKLEKDVLRSDLNEGPQINEKQGTTKGMQTMLRLTSSNHISLSDMADSKANILISVNAIMISVILSVLLRRLQTDSYLTIPTVIFLLGSLCTIVIAILATRPKISIGTFNDDDIIHKKTNLLFFGNFHKVPQEKYEKAMRSMMNDPDYLYSSIIQDIYHLGVVLGKKYKLIRLAYNVFMAAIIISVISFTLAAALHSEPPATNITTNTSGSPF